MRCLNLLHLCPRCTMEFEDESVRSTCPSCDAPTYSTRAVDLPRPPAPTEILPDGTRLWLLPWGEEDIIIESAKGESAKATAIRAGLPDLAVYASFDIWTNAGLLIDTSRALPILRHFHFL